MHLPLQMGMDGVFVGSGIFKSGDAAKRARAIVQVLSQLLLIVSWNNVVVSTGASCLKALLL